MKRFLRATVIGSGLALAFATCLAAFAWRESERILNAAISVPVPVLYELEKGSTMSRLAHDFEVNGWVASGWLFAWRARLGRNAQALQAGVYEIAPGDTPRNVLARIVAGRTRRFEVRFIEGSRFEDMRRVLARQPYLRQSLAGKDAREILELLGIERESPEGMFFPSTYHYAARSTDIAILARAHHRLTEILENAWRDRAPDLPYTSSYDALIMASIIEKETGRADERHEIAGVFVRRLQRGMRLQTDPTVIYGLGEGFDGNLRRTDLGADTPFNTYTRPGLPPTPIAMPGEAAIRAALAPAPGTSLYFVARGDGSHEFSETLTEHNAAVRRFQLAQ